MLEYYSRSRGEKVLEGREMKLLALYLREFNQDYLSIPADRREFWVNLVNFMATAALFVVAAVIMWVLA